MKFGAPLKRLASVIPGQSPPSDEVEDFTGEGLPFLQGNAEFGPQHPKPRHRCDSASKRAEPGDLLISVRAPVGALNIADRGYGIGRGLAAIRPRPQFDAQYCWWWLHSVVEDLKSIGMGSTYEAVTADDIGSLRVPVTAIDEQQETATFLDAETSRIDALIAKKRELIELLEKRFEAEVFAGATRGLRGEELKQSGLGWIGSIPRSWGTPPVSANFDLQLGKMLSSDAVQGPDHYPYLRNVNVQWDRFELTDLGTMHFSEEERRKFALRSGDVLVCEGGEVGRAAVWAGELEDCYFQKALHRVRPRRDANGRFLMYVLRAAAKLNVFAVEGNLSTIVHLTGEQLRAHRFPWPQVEEQAEIVRHLDAAAEFTAHANDRLVRQIELIQEHRQALITAAVTGNFEISDAVA